VLKLDIDNLITKENQSIILEVTKNAISQVIIPNNISIENYN
jgi:hypothetical protein